MPSTCCLHHTIGINLWGSNHTAMIGFTTTTTTAHAPITPFLRKQLRMLLSFDMSFELLYTGELQLTQTAVGGLLLLIRGELVEVCRFVLL